MLIFNKKSLIMIVFFILLSFNCASKLYADYVPSEVRDSIEQELDSYKGALENDKENFGMNSGDNVSQVTLGEGYPYYSVATSFLNEKEVADEVESEQVFDFEGYVFPIELNGDPVGVVFAKETDGKWDIYKISSNLTFEEDIKKAEIKLTEDQDNAKVIYDARFGVKAVATDSEFVAMSQVENSDDFKIKKNEKKELQSFAQEVHSYSQEMKKESKAQRGTFGGSGSGYADSTSSINSYILIIVCITGALLSVAGVILYRRKSVKKS